MKNYEEIKEILVKDENGSIEWNGNKFREEKVEVE